MRVERRILFVLLVIALSGMLVFFSPMEESVLHVVAIFVLSLASCYSAKFNIYHPLCWFPPFIFLYSCSYPILNYFEKVPSYGYSSVPLQYTWFSISILIILLISLKTKKIVIKTFTSIDQKKLNGFANALLIIVVLSCFFIIESGFSGKDEIYENGGFFINLVFKAIYLLLLTYIFLLIEKYRIEESPSFLWFGKFFFTIVFFSLLTGERNYMFQFVLVTMLIMSLYDRISKKMLIALIPLGIILLPLSHMFKYYLSTGLISGEVYFDEIIFLFLKGEFQSAGNNMQILVNNNCYNYFEGASLFNDFIRIFYDTGYSNQTWFNDTFFPNSRVKYGFTLIGEGYVNGGYFGVFVIFSLISILIRILYKHIDKSIYYVIIYIYMIPIFIYSIRADISNVFSPLIKYAILGTFLLKFIAKSKV